MFFGLIKKKPDSHLVLNKAYANFLINGRFVTLFYNHRLATCYSSCKLINFVLVFFNNLSNVFFTYFSKVESKIVYREFSNYSILLLLPFLLPIKHKLFLNVNHNITNDFFKSILPLTIISRFGIRFILFDGVAASRNLPLAVSRNIITPMFPVHACLKKLNKFHANSIKVGFVGDFRDEKGGVGYLTNILKIIIPNLHIKWYIGSRSKQFAEISSCSNVKVFNTRSDYNYFKFLSLIDILIVNGSMESYMYRHSGTIVDAISNDVIVIAPELYVFNEQLTNPVRVGFNFGSIDEIPHLIQFAVANKELLIDNIVKYKLQRRLVNVDV